MQQQDNHEYPFLYQRQTCHQVQPNQATYQKDRKSGSAGMPRPISYAVFCLKKKIAVLDAWHRAGALGPRRWIAGGGAHPRAVAGHVLAGLELAGQLASPPDAIVLPLGTGGTAAGLALAVTVLGWPTRVVGVRVAPRIVANRWRTTWLAYAARRLLAHRAVPLPAPRSLDIVDGLGE